MEIKNRTLRVKSVKDLLWCYYSVEDIVIVFTWCELEVGHKRILYKFYVEISQFLLIYQDNLLL